MEITLAQLKRACKGKPDTKNAQSLLIAVNKYGAQFGLDQPHRLVMFFSQWMHESGSFRYDKEIWGPTPAQIRYEGRKDLGNTKKGDGKRFMGRTGAQLTGRANYRSFTAWVRRFIDKDAPDFEANPELINSDPWEGLVPIWYWSVGNPSGKSLNRYADEANHEMVTKLINGGKNGFADRLDNYDRLGLVVLGYGPTEYGRFQTNAKNTSDYDGKVDNLSGPRTRASIHRKLVKLTEKVDRSEDVKAAPVVVETPVAVPVKELEKPAWQSPEVLLPAATPILTGIAGLDWRVAVAAFIVGAAVAVFLIVRRDRMKKRQEASVTAIEAQAI